jgi:SAM-dependent methyltransferase
MDGERAQRLWDAKAGEWDRHIGDGGDGNRRLNSDPVLWRFLGDVAGLDVLDAGCGTGYLAAKLASRGARVVGIDWSPGMVAVARDRATRLGVDVALRVDSCSELRSVPDGSVDRIVSNYVLMDVPDLDGAAVAFARVLRPGGRAVVVISHPAFGPPGGAERLDDGSVRYRWPFPYFEDTVFDESWGVFATPFVCYHRSLTGYWRRFREAGFELVDLEEPVVPDPEAVAPQDRQRALGYRMTPFSLALNLRRR